MALQSPLSLAFAAAIFLIALPSGFANEPHQPASIAVIDFDYRDTSGEVRDATAEHRKRLNAFMSAMRTDLAAGGQYRLVDVTCASLPCSLSNSTPSELIDQVKRAGARFLLYGGIHKESTLVQWAKVQVVDIEADKLVVDRLLTFRGDTDEAWNRAENFIVKELKEKLASK